MASLPKSHDDLPRCYCWPMGAQYPSGLGCFLGIENTKEPKKIPGSPPGLGKSLKKELSKLDCSLEDD